jgi:hypothetical protein
MATPENATPVLFDRALLAARQHRARRQGAVTFLLDRVAEDFSDRLAAVKREFLSAADLWTPGELQLPRARIRSRALRPTAARRCSSHRNRSTSLRQRWRCNSSTTCPACSRKSAVR